MSAGRPKIGLSDLPENWQDDVIFLMSEGASQTEIMAELDISRDTYYRLLDDEPEFLDTIKKGLILSQAWWEKQGRKNLITGQGVSFNSTLWFMNMKNRFKEDWRDKQELEVDAKVETNPDTALTEKLDRLTTILDAARTRRDSTSAD